MGSCAHAGGDTQQDEQQPDSTRLITKSIRRRHRRLCRVRANLSAPRVSVFRGRICSGAHGLIEQRGDGAGRYQCVLQIMRVGMRPQIDREIDGAQGVERWTKRESRVSVHSTLSCEIAERVCSS